MQQQRESPHKALIGLWERPDRAWIGFRKPGCGEGRRARLNRTHASFLNSLAGPKKGRENGGREIKERGGEGGWSGALQCKLDFECRCKLGKIAVYYKTPPPPPPGTGVHRDPRARWECAHLKSVKIQREKRRKET